MITVEYTPDGPPCSDFQAEQKARQLRPGDKVQTSSEVFVMAVRSAVAQGRLKNVCFVWQGQEVVCDQHGHLPHHPAGFCDIHTDFLMEIVRHAPKPNLPKPK